MKIQVLSQGGLGNQLFQANYAHFLAKNNGSLKIRFVNHNIPQDREFELTDFFDGCIHVREISDFNKNADFVIKAWRSLSRRLKILSKFLNFAFGILEAPDAYSGVKLQKNHLILTKLFRRDLKLVGHFQSSAFVSLDDCFGELLKAFVLKNSSRTSSFSEVVVHMRQGDYYENKSMGPLSKDYFDSVLKSINPEPNTLVVHSDGEIDLTRFPIAPKSREVGKPLDNPFDLLLDASFSSIFIGSNSSLSWWGSYLQEFNNNSGISIFPTEWMRGAPTDQLPLFRNSWKLHPAAWT